MDVHFLILQATERICGRLGTLKDMYGSGVREFHNLADQLSLDSQSTFEQLKSQAVTHKSILEEVGIFLSPVMTLFY